MKEFKNKKWSAAAIIMIIILVAAVWNNISLRKENSKFREIAVFHIASDWYEVYRLSELIDKQYIKNNLSEGLRFRLYVNQVCQNNSLRAVPSELNINMSELLVQAYDPLFQSIVGDGNPKDMKKAEELLKSMNKDVMLVSKSLVEMEDSSKEKLMDNTSQEYIKISTQVKDISNKYIKLVDDYFRNSET
jgi:hypothetical protein